ncbi:MAG: ATP-binding protein [Phormidesmis sp.]
MISQQFAWSLQHYAEALLNLVELYQQIKAADVHDGINSTLLILSSKLKPITVTKDYGDCPLIECFPAQLNQVFMNILANAADALLADTAAAVSQPSQSDPPRSSKQLEILIATHSIEDNSVQITITDNGCWNPRTVVDRVFDPFFTTKPMRSGTGLGLSISHQTVTDRHQGTLHYRSIGDQETSFIIKIPTTQQTAS